MVKIILAVGALLTLISIKSQAMLIAQYDMLEAIGTNQTTLAPSFVASGYAASNLVLNNASNSAFPFGNHFYHDGWDATFNSAKYYETTISGPNPFQLGSVMFSLEDLEGTSASYWLRTSLDSFAADIATGTFSNGDVTDFNVNLSGLGMLAAPIAFRWYIADDSVAGFANHECRPLGSILEDAGCGLPDVGMDLLFKGVPTPATLALFGLGLAGLGWSRRKNS